MGTVIRNVTLVSTQGRHVAEEKIDPVQEIDGTGKFLIPGVIDVHVHFRDPGFPEKEDWESGSRAALHGGVTTVLEMPNTNPSTITGAALEAKRVLATARSLVRFGLFFGATSDNLNEIEKAENVVGIKVYMGSSTGGLLVDDPVILEKIFLAALRKNLAVVVHAEDETLIRRGDRSCACALRALESALNLQEKIGNRLHIAHVTCAAELERIAQFKKKAQGRLSCEVTPHHLFFTEEDQDAFLKMFPPLRSKNDQAALWEGLRSGTIDCVATDHAPHTKAEKSVAFEDAPAGVPSIEFLLPLMLNAVNEGQLSMERLVEVLCKRPREIFQLPSNDDRVLVDMNMERTIEPSMIKSRCGWSPYVGRKLRGWPLKVWLGDKTYGPIDI